MPLPVRPPKTAMLLARRIAADIHARGNRPGDRLPPENKMLAEYEVGRGTLREALRFLELQGVVALKPGPHGGPIVQAPDPAGLSTPFALLLQLARAPFRAVVEARGGLEPMLARLAATAITSSDLDSLDECIRRMADDLDDQPSFLAANRHFHETVARGADNPLLRYVLLAVLDLLDEARLRVEYSSDDRAAVLAAHRRVVEAIRAKDGPAAEAAMSSLLHRYRARADELQPEKLAAPMVWGGR